MPQIIEARLPPTAVRLRPLVGSHDLTVRLARPARLVAEDLAAGDGPLPGHDSQ